MLVLFSLIKARFAKWDDITKTMTDNATADFLP